MRRATGLVRSIALGLTCLATTAVPALAGPFKVAIWYDRRDPIRTFRHRAYDVGKGEYRDDAVRRWSDVVHRGFPSYAVLIKDVAVAPGSSPDAERRAITRATSEVLGPYIRAQAALYSGLGTASAGPAFHGAPPRSSPPRMSPIPRNSYQPPSSLIPGVYPGRVR